MDPFSQELRFREAGVQRDNVYRDIGVSGATGTDQRHGWHRLDGRLSGGDILVVVRPGNGSGQPSCCGGLRIRRTVTNGPNAPMPSAAPPCGHHPTSLPELTL